MVKELYLIHEAAKEVHVEAHVLRYWEEELGLPIRRNEQGHRIYTQEDIDRLIRVKNLKDQGLQLKAVKTVLEQMPQNEEGEEDMKAGNPFAQKQLTKISRNGDMKVIPLKTAEEMKWRGQQMIEIKEKKVTPAQKQEIAIKMKENEKLQSFEQEKVARMQYLFQKMIKEAVEENNSRLIEKITDNIKDDVCKELDYQFRLLEEREEERDHVRNAEERKAQEEHFRKVDELLRQYHSKSVTKEKNKKEFRFLKRAEAK